MEKTNVTRQCFKKVPLDVSCQLCILHQQCGLEIAELRKKFHGYPSYITNNCISMNKGIDAIIAEKGHRIKY